MNIFEIDGPCKLSGTVEISGAKNAALPIMAAAVLGNGKSVLESVPDIADIRTMFELLNSIGVKCQRIEDGKVEVDASNIDQPFGDYDIVRKMRASFCIIGPLLARCGHARVSLPGGCSSFGHRPVDIHLKGLQALGAEISIENGYVTARVPEGGLVGTEIFLGGTNGPTVLGTANVLMAASMAKGTTVLEYAACEPEIQDLARFMQKMGAKISGIGTQTLTVEGVSGLKPVEHKIIPDRIEAGTFMVGAVMTQSRITISNCCPEHLRAPIDCLRQMGTRISVDKNSMEVSHTGKIRPAHLTTQPYPGFPTDLQAQFMAMLCLASGNSFITEKIFPERFSHVAELNRLSAEINKVGSSVVISGKESLQGAPVMASDLRASAALVLAGLAAEGRTIVNRVYHIDRGYEDIVSKLRALGANIERKHIDD
jgi:UDP-N-acetylglucosamine 1-carboxyvinyltransferase